MVYRRLVVYASFASLALFACLDQTTVTALAIAPHHVDRPVSTTVSTPLRPLRAGASTPLKMTASAPAEAAPPKKRIRITAFDGARFLLATHIVLGHFIRYANPPAFLLKFFAQVNISVGAFFALSGYVTAYTTTEVGKREASPKLTEVPAQKWWLQKLFGYAPMHWLVLLLFSPMFVYSDMTYGGLSSAVANGAMSATFTQAFFPMHAEAWNAPTWFLSALTFATGLLPFCMPKIAAMDKRALRRTAGWLFLLKLLPTLGYLHDSNTWALVEGMTPPKKHPALAVFNAQRFSPFYNVAEILLGAVVCRLAMLDGTGDEKDKTPTTNWLSTAVPAIGMVAVLALRATDIFPACSDMLVRTCLFVPLLLRFLLGAHRNAVASVKSDPISSFLSSKPMVWLGGLSFPIFIVHGPLGQVFYKKLIATKLWGKVLFGPEYFLAYTASVLALAYLLNTLFFQSSSVKAWSKSQVEELAKWM